MGIPPKECFLILTREFQMIQIEWFFYYIAYYVMWVPWVLKGAEKVAISTGIRTHGPLKKVKSYKKENSQKI